ncbi:MAG: alpha/beta hydrolase [Actinomycetota bacterium]|nr:alpha/beta hydrolase [Actinomycetota bacterium]
MARDILSIPPPPAGVRLRYGAGQFQFGDLRLPSSSGPYPVVVSVHGGFWRERFDLEYMGHACAALTDLGVATWNIEYRRIGNPGGGWPGTFHDVAAAADYLRDIAPKYNLDLRRLAAIGHSAGGHLAMWLAARSRLSPDSPLYSPAPIAAAAISLAGVVDLRAAWEMALSGGVVREFMGGTPDEVPDRYSAASPIELLPLDVRQVLVHGTRDESVPYEISKRYYDAAIAKGDDATLVTLPGAEHFAPVNPDSPEWQVVADAVCGVLAL